MTNKEKARASQKRFNERHYGLTKKRNKERYMRLRGNAVKLERDVLKKEINETKKYIKEIWGRETPLKETSYQEMKKLGEELGMNVFNVKSFDEKYKDQKYFKETTRCCKYCNKYYDIKIKIKIRPKRSGICPTCKKKHYNNRHERRKIKNKIKWEQLILDVLKKNSRLTVLDIASELGCSGYPIRWALNGLAKDGKVRFFKIGKSGFVSIV